VRLELLTNKRREWIKINPSVPFNHHCGLIRPTAFVT